MVSSCSFGAKKRGQNESTVCRFSSVNTNTKWIIPGAIVNKIHCL
jgi:hypothetical protein